VAPQEVWQLLQEFQGLISGYVIAYQPADANEWRIVIAEVTAFLQVTTGAPVTTGRPTRHAGHAEPVAEDVPRTGIVCFSAPVRVAQTLSKPVQARPCYW
jgi:hypothetical protein